MDATASKDVAIARKRRDAAASDDDDGAAAAAAVLLPPKKPRSIRPTEAAASPLAALDAIAAATGTDARGAAAAVTDRLPSPRKDLDGCALSEAGLDAPPGTASSARPRLRRGHARPHPHDLESALHRVVAMGSEVSPSGSGSDTDTNTGTTTDATGPRDATGTDDNGVERVAPDAALRFRLGHAGDASAIAALYRQCRCQSAAREDDPVGAGSSAAPGTARPKPAGQGDLEVWLAEGLGNEDVPPSAFALVAEVHPWQATGNNDDATANDALGSSARPDLSVVVAAVAILTQAWYDGHRRLRVAWLYLRAQEPWSSLVERRLWLRLSAVALLTAAEGIVVTETASAASQGEAIADDSRKDELSTTEEGRVIDDSQQNNVNS